MSEGKARRKITVATCPAIQLKASCEDEKNHDANPMRMLPEAELEKHSSEDNAWMAVHGLVLNLSKARFIDPSASCFIERENAKAGNSRARISWTSTQEART